MNRREFVTWEGLLGWGYSDDACMKEFTPIQIQRIKDMGCARSGLRSFAPISCG